MPHIKTQVHFFEPGMERESHTLNFYLIKQKTHEAYIAGIVVKIQFDAGGQKRFEYSRINCIIGHNELAPFGSEESGGHEIVTGKGGGSSVDGKSFRFSVGANKVLTKDADVCAFHFEYTNKP
jgi:hypothetical protein